MVMVQCGGGSDELLQNIQNPDRNHHRLPAVKQPITQNERNPRLRIERIWIILLQVKPGILLSSRPHLLSRDRIREADNGEEDEEDARKASHLNLRTVSLCCSRGNDGPPGTKGVKSCYLMSIVRFEETMVKSARWAHTVLLYYDEGGAEVPHPSG